MSFVNTYFDRVYVVNLERRPDRRKSAMQQLMRCGISATFVQAVDGSNFHNQVEYEKYLYRPQEAWVENREGMLKRKLIENAGVWATLKSHYFILRDAKKNNYRRILCLEDDIILHKNFEELFTEKINQIPQNWKLLFLGALQRKWQIPRDLAYLDPNKKKVNPRAPFYLPRSTDSTFAYAIDYSVFDLMLEGILEGRSPIDVEPQQLVFNRFPNQCFVINPNLMIMDVTDSDLRKGMDQTAVAKLQRWNLEHYQTRISAPSEGDFEKRKPELFSKADLDFRRRQIYFSKKYQAVFLAIPNTIDFNFSKKFEIQHLAANTETADFREGKFTFTVVRNPWSRLVAAYQNCIKSADYNHPGFEDGVATELTQFPNKFYGGMRFHVFAEAVCSIPDCFAPNVFRSQFFQFIDPNGQLEVRYLGRFEDRQASLNFINSATGLGLKMEDFSKTEALKYHSFYTEELIKKVENRYFLDVHLLQYDFKNKTLGSPIDLHSDDWKNRFDCTYIFSKYELLGKGFYKNLKLDLQIAQNELKAIKNSYSWQWTAPFRRILKQLENLKN